MTAVAHTGISQKRQKAKYGSLDELTPAVEIGKLGCPEKNCNDRGLHRVQTGRWTGAQRVKWVEPTMPQIRGIKQMQFIRQIRRVKPF
jgi:hypothetical protein